ncbi:hypothetical protein [Geomonas edaphica]|uniref:hypothetical protein n=1 Tax=Geomonas edaphica TaxID=2570226 RepID=UPI0010A934C2|nr:hypothetical protein [Geomonas edaphica]
MRGMKAAIAFLLVLTVDIADGNAGFHNGGTGACDGCHGSLAAAGSSALQPGTTTSEICLRCHAAARPEDYQVATSPAPPHGVPLASLTPGGDFAYLTKQYYWSEANGARAVSPGERHGHNIAAPAYGYFPDATLTSSPGGTYPSDALSCISCHDPHGNYRVTDSAGTVTASGNPVIGSGSYGASPSATDAVGSYRLLAGRGYGTRGTSHEFVYDPPIAVAPREYNRGEDSGDTRVAYGKGSSEWCLNCHGGLSNWQGSAHLHPSGVALGEAIAKTYNHYVKSGDLSGNESGAFTSLVPFQSGDLTDVRQLASITTSHAGPKPDDKVMCLTCHRAHASAFDAITRWDTKETVLTVNGGYPGTDAVSQGSDPGAAGGKTRAEYRVAMYDRAPSHFGRFQRSLCNKCHAMD